MMNRRESMIILMEKCESNPGIINRANTTTEPEGVQCRGYVGSLDILSEEHRVSGGSN